MLISLTIFLFCENLTQLCLLCSGPSKNVQLHGTLLLNEQEIPILCNLKIYHNVQKLFD